MARKHTARKGFLARLLHSTSANVLPLTAALLIPLLGLVGGGVDMSRLYLVKTRMQQACDAGALAGRKAMGNGNWTTSGSTSTNGRATAIFDGNFKQGDYGSGTLTKSYSESGGVVTGTASADVPMAVMKVLGFTSKTIAVTCTAKMEIPNTDVMFVLDVTGSMAWTNSGDTDTKINGLKSAVKCFYEALVRVNTAEICGNDPATTTYNGQAQIRIGFVPYSVNVNVGKLLPNSFLADTWKYQTREGVFYMPGPPTGGSYNETATFDSKWKCNSWANGETASGFPSDSQTLDSFTATTTNYVKTGYNGKTDVCTRRVDQSTVVYTRDDANGTYFHTWKYDQHELNVSGLKAGGSSWNNSINRKIGDDGTEETVYWNGCIEERQTHQVTSSGNIATDWATIPSSAYDMDIDMVPSGTNGTKWGPMLGDVVFERYSSTSNWGSSSYRTGDPKTTSYNANHESETCPAEARKLQEWTTPSPFETYVNSLNPVGNTYHDIGMIWGARFISPTGIFASENAATPTGQPIQRHIIFMTDGDTQTSTSNYTAHGIHWWDRRQTSFAPSSTNLDDIVNARLTALCTAIKNRNITLWVVSFGSGVSSSAQTRLSACASSGKFFNASNSATLMSNFQQIASEIADLRLTS